MVFKSVLDSPLEESQEVIVLSDHIVEDLRVFFAELGIVEATVCDSLSINRFRISYISSVKAIRVLDDNVKPDIFLDLTYQVSECTCGNALYRCFVL